MNIIAKLLLNSLYGRFGMNPDKANHIILTDNIEKDKIMLKNEILNIIDFGNGKELISYIPKIDNELIEIINDESCDSSMMINVAVASAVTGLSRMHMSYFKNNPLFKIYYSDTDSAFIDIPLESININLIGNELGQLKFENEFKTIVFLAPKVYGGITTEGKQVVKAKGVKNIIPYEDLESLLQKGLKLKISSEK
jgi:DNA polymerase elongation subunit (family B)